MDKIIIKEMLKNELRLGIFIGAMAMFVIGCISISLYLIL
jgi:hypothetical protein